MGSNTNSRLGPDRICTYSICSKNVKGRKTKRPPTHRSSSLHKFKAPKNEGWISNNRRAHQECQIDDSICGRLGKSKRKKAARRRMERNLHSRGSSASRREKEKKRKKKSMDKSEGKTPSAKSRRDSQRIKEAKECRTNKSKQKKEKRKKENTIQSIDVEEKKSTVTVLEKISTLAPAGSRKISAASLTAIWHYRKATAATAVRTTARRAWHWSSLFLPSTHFPLWQGKKTKRPARQICKKKSIQLITANNIVNSWMV